MSMPLTTARMMPTILRVLLDDPLLSARADIDIGTELWDVIWLGA